MTATTTRRPGRTGSGPRDVSRAPMDPRMRERLVAVKRAEGRRRLRVLVGAASLLVSLLLGVLLLHSPWLSVSHIEIEGAAAQSLGQVRAAAAPALHRPLVSVPAAAITQAEEALPWVRSARVGRSWPSTLVVWITMRHAVAAVPAGPSWAEVDGTGRVLQVGSARPAGLVEVTGDPGQVRAGGYVARDLRPALVLAGALPPAIRSQVQSVSIDGRGRASVRLSGGAIVDFGPPSGLAAKMAALETVLQQVSMAKVTSIDLRVPTRPALTRG